MTSKTLFIGSMAGVAAAILVAAVVSIGSNNLASAQMMATSFVADGHNNEKQRAIIFHQDLTLCLTTA